MKLNYRADTDSLYIDLSERPSVRSQEVAEGIALGFDDEGHVAGIDIVRASQTVKMDRVDMASVPTKDNVVDDDDPTWQERVRAASLPNSKLIELAAKHPPPESWFEETDDPFQPEDKPQS